MESNFSEIVIDLYKNNKWKEIIQLNENSNNLYARKLLWVWPSEENFKFIQYYIKSFNKEGVISIGCGSGLLEWLLHKFIQLPVLGYEVNQTWWQSKYSGPKFIQLQFNNNHILYSNFALIFCYFNDGKAVKEYVRSYEGNLIFIVGPGDGSGRHTNPEPFSPDFENSGWHLKDYQEVKDTKDFIAVYVKCM